MTKSYGEGIYTAYRQDGVLHVHASGTKPYAQTKVTLEELPFLIFPPQIGLFFDTEGIVSPVILPFDIERAFVNYPLVPTVHIVDKNGGHAINIEERPSSQPVHTDVSTQAYVVYQQIGTQHYLIAKADAIVIAIYTKVFGPDSYENCQKYVAAHTSAASPAIDLVPGSLKAWIDQQPGSEPRLIVTAQATVEIDWKVEIVEAQPQGINPFVKVLKVVVQLPEGGHSNAIATRTLRYEEPLAKYAYTDATLHNGGQTVSVKVTVAK
jgi:hypothetical protein